MGWRRKAPYRSESRGKGLQSSGHMLSGGVTVGVARAWQLESQHFLARRLRRAPRFLDGGAEPGWRKGYNAG